MKQRIGKISQTDSEWPLLPEKLVEVFGNASDVAKAMVRTLYSVLESSPERTKKLFFAWQTLFGQVTGTENQQTPEIMQWAARFQIKMMGKQDIPRLFFCIHTYLSLVLKLVCADVVTAARHEDSPPFSVTLSRSEEVQELLGQLENNNVFTQNQIANFIEDNFFAWYLDGWTTSLNSVIHSLASTTARFDLKVANLTPRSRVDLFKHLYQDLIPEKIRHSFGEYYTPDWLAEHVIRAAGYDGNPARRVLDPCCGSGTFLLSVLVEVETYLRKNGETLAFVDFINDAHVAGFDINPIAVLATKANLLLFLAPYLRGSPKTVTLPVFLRDVILDLGRDGEVPEEYYDFILGNPPWVKWSNLPADYRTKIQPTCKNYDLFSTDAWVGGIESDISTVITFIAADRWLKLGGVLAFLLPQTVFQTASAEGFRRFRLPDQSYLKVSAVEDLKDIKPFEGAQNETALLVAEKSTDATPFPVPYRVWTKRTKGMTLSPGDSLSAILSQVNVTTFEATPVLENHLKWLIAPPGKADTFHLLQTREGIKLRARKGTTTDFNNIFWVKAIRPAEKRRVTIRNGNCAAGHTIATIDHLMEEELLFPLIRGADVARFKVKPPSLAIIVPQRSMRGFDAASMQQNYPEALRYFERYRDAACTGCRTSIACRKGLLQRACFTKYHAAIKEYWAIWNVGDYTFCPYKLVWREIGGKRFFAAVLEPALLGPLPEKCVIPDHKLMMVPFDNRTEAHFYCALLNSQLIREFAAAITTDTSHGTRIFDCIGLPAFDASNETHRLLASLSVDAHSGRRLMDNEFEEKLEELAQRATAH